MPSRRSAPRRSAKSAPAFRQAVRSTSPVWHRLLSTVTETNRLGRLIGSVLEGGEVLALSGPLGAGKTALVRGIATGLGAPARAVSSPTFVLLHEYRGRVPLVHVDLYRLTAQGEAESIGLGDYLSGQTVVAVEWAEKAPHILPDDRLELELRHRTVQSRSIDFRATGPLSSALLARVKYGARLARKRPGQVRWRNLKGKASS
ncbi:MAG TPA: tRNA (adenosine(37)-N6)-threonylcarbamoyltransferase complex ATPase subunit type 1 TsaE [Chthoniobacterales bacterium]|jgi:tRNA threonylcarbamoyladenosine biosynthesis protein TsaE|nr:tRNA (adenosine(37)-N6)-threonylcarbamoyltransferase complex ATPase subunit type 1 TsaE [Chthoniobacterales bacterium]